MSKKSRRSGFTLIEVLIVVIIMAVLAATIIPQFSASTKDAKESSVKFNMHTLRSQIEMYKVHHLGNYPTTIDGNKSMPQLLLATDVNGNTGTTAPDATHPFGPYIDQQLPANPFNNLNTVKAASLGGAKPGTGDNSTGWIYDSATGAVWPNNPEFYAN